MRRFILPGTTIAKWTGVKVWQRNDKGLFKNITDEWSWSEGYHTNYEVHAIYDENKSPIGSYWVPASTKMNPKHWKLGATPIEVNPKLEYIPGHIPIQEPFQTVNPRNIENRPRGTYIWIPDESIPKDTPISSVADIVRCDPPSQYPPPTPENLESLIPSNEELQDQFQAVISRNEEEKNNDDKTFQDSDGLISFVNLSSSFVQHNPEYKLGREVCDKISNFFVTTRSDMFNNLKKNPSQVPAGHKQPQTKWDPAVTNYIRCFLSSTGALTNYTTHQETYSRTEIITEFSTSFVKAIFDTAFVPENVIGDVTDFLNSVGEALRASWDNKKRTYQVHTLAQCHEAIPIDTSDTTTVYFPKIKYYYILVDSTQKAFKSGCSTVREVTFNFTYHYYVTGLAHSVFDKESQVYQNLMGMLNAAQEKNYKDSRTLLDTILHETSSTENTSDMHKTDENQVNIYGVNLNDYPRTKKQPKKPSPLPDDKKSSEEPIETILNKIVSNSRE